jgi:hypothetical protein
MKLIQLERANKVLGEIKELDEQIIKIEKMAIEMTSEEERDVSITMSFDKPKEPEAKIDEDGYDGFMGFRFMIAESPFRRYGYDEKKTLKESMFVQFDNSECLQILGMMLMCKQQRRQRLLNQLQKLGFAVQ